CSGGHRVSRVRRCRDGVRRGCSCLSTLVCRPRSPLRDSARIAYKRMSPMNSPRIAVAISSLIWLLAGCASSANAPGTEAMPKVPAATAAPGPISQVLPNGLRLIVQDHRAGNIVAIYLWIGVGVRYDKPDELGYSHFMEHMLFKGTDKWGPGYIDRAVEG